MNKLPNFIYQLGAIALLTTSSCARTQPTTETSPSATPTATATPTPTNAVNATPVALLTSEQQAELMAVGVKVVVPSYVPDGFRIDELIANKGAATTQPDRPTDSAHYQITYRHGDGTCFRIGSGNQGWRDSPQDQTVVATPKFGQVNVDYGSVKRETGDINIVQAVIPGAEGYWLDSGKDDQEPCKPLPLEEFTKILQSFDYLQAGTSPAATPTAMAGVDPNCSGYFRQITTPDRAPVKVKADDGTEKAVNHGDTVLFNVAAARGDRSEITLPGGFKGWIDDKFLATTPVGGSQFTGKMQVKTLDGGEVNLREQPSLDGKIVGTVPDGAALTVKGQKTGYWWSVTTETGTSGYVADQFLICK